jgi:hypothetical protein
MLVAGLLVSLWIAQIPCSPTDSTLSCKCKQDIVGACDVLAESDPTLAKDILRLLAMAKAAKEANKGKTQTATVQSGCPDPGDDEKKCTGQEHHVISKRSFQALQEHPTLGGLHQLRDPRFVTRAADLKAHCGWWGWHQQLDEEVASWVTSKKDLTPKQFEAYLREVYARPELRARFPNGF